MSHVDWGMLLLKPHHLLLDISHGFHCQVGLKDHGWLSPAGLTHQLLWCVVFVSSCQAQAAWLSTSHWRQRPRRRGGRRLGRRQDLWAGRCSRKSERLGCKAGASSSWHGHMSNCVSFWWPILGRHLELGDTRKKKGMEP